MTNRTRDSKEFDFKIHPALAIIPEMDATTFDGLKADIKEHGQRRSITLFDGMLLDGRARLRACLGLGIEPSIQEIEACDGAEFDPIAWVLSVNVFRQHLSSSQLATIATKCAARQPETMRTKTKP